MRRSVDSRIRQLTERLGPVTPAPPIQQVTYSTAYQQPDGTLLDEDGQLIADGPPLSGMDGRPPRVNRIIVVVPAAGADGPDGIGEPNPGP